jgi:hypothetical protein
VFYWHAANQRLYRLRKVGSTLAGVWGAVPKHSYVPILITMAKDSLLDDASKLKIALVRSGYRHVQIESASGDLVPERKESK